MNKPHLIARRAPGASYFLVACVNLRGCRMGFGMTFGEALARFFENNR